MNIWQKAIAVVITGPLGLWMFDLYPPIGSESFLFNSVFSITICAIGYVLSILFVDNLSQRVIAGRIFLASSVLLLFLYASAYIINVESVEQQQNGETVIQRMIVGNDLLDSRNTGYSRKELIVKYGSVENIWTRESILVNKLILFLSYNFSFLLLISGLVFTHKKD